MKTFFICAMLLFSQQALAYNTHCDRLKKPHDVEQCYYKEIKQGSKQMAVAMKKLIAVSNEQAKQVMLTNQTQWEHRIEAECKSMGCFDEAIRERTLNFNKEYNRVVLQ